MHNRNYFFITLTIAAAVILLGAAKTRASEPRQTEPGPQGRTIRVSGTAVVYGKPDYATIDLGVVKTSTGVVSAKSACDQAMLKVQASIRKAGVAPEDIQTTSFQIYPVQPPKGPRQWKVVHQISVRVRKVENVASVLDSAIAGGATDVSQVTYAIEKIMDLRSKARTEAVRVAREKAQELARLNNVQLGEPNTISDSSYGGYYQSQSTSNAYIDYGGSTRSMNVMSQGQIAVDAREDIEFAIR